MFRATGALSTAKVTTATTVNRPCVTAIAVATGLNSIQRLALSTTASCNVHDNTNEKGGNTIPNNNGARHGLPQGGWRLRSGRSSGSPPATDSPSSGVSSLSASDYEMQLAALKSQGENAASANKIPSTTEIEAGRSEFARLKKLARNVPFKYNDEMLHQVSNDHSQVVIEPASNTIGELRKILENVKDTVESWSNEPLNLETQRFFKALDETLARKENRPAENSTMADGESTDIKSTARIIAKAKEKDSPEQEKVRHAFSPETFRTMLEFSPEFLENPALGSMSPFLANKVLDTAVNARILSESYRRLVPVDTNLKKENNNSPDFDLVKAVLNRAGDHQRAILSSREAVRNGKEPTYKAEKQAKKTNIVNDQSSSAKKSNSEEESNMNKVRSKDELNLEELFSDLDLKTNKPFDSSSQSNAVEEDEKTKALRLGFKDATRRGSGKFGEKTFLEGDVYHPKDLERQTFMKNEKRPIASPSYIVSDDIWKYPEQLRMFTFPTGGIMPRERTGLNSRQHKKVVRAVKRARCAGLLAYDYMF